MSFVCNVFGILLVIFTQMTMFYISLNYTTLKLEYISENQPINLLNVEVYVVLISFKNIHRLRSYKHSKLKLGVELWGMD